MQRVRGRLAGVLRLGVTALAFTTSLWPHAARAQAVSGTILGTVRDATGGAVPHASVTLAHVATGLTRTVTTGAEGAYAAPLLATGAYTVSAQTPGFKKTSVTGVLLGVDNKVRVDLSLEVGVLTESVLVQSENPLVQTSSSDLSATLGETQIQTLPVNARNFVTLARTIPGVSRGVPGENIDGAGTLGWRLSASFTANGQRNRDNSFLLDGVDNNETWLNTVVIFPSLDALEEFKVQTSIYAAEFGRSLGGVVSLQTKSGTNRFFGSAFEFLRNGKLDANDWFSNKNGFSRPAFGQHQFGATLGGPIVKGRSFFFADYQGWRIEKPLTLVSTVPTDLMRRGDFSELNRAIYDPSTGLPFPGRVIPAERIDPSARAIVERFYPTANVAGTRNAAGQIINNYVANPSEMRHDDQFDVRIDHNLGSRNRMFARYSFEKSNRFAPSSFPDSPAGDGMLAGDYEVKAQSLALNDTHTFGSGWLNELRLGWNAIDIGFVPVASGQDLARQVGISGINDIFPGMVYVLQQEVRALGSGVSTSIDASALQVTDSLTHVRGRHTWKAGASLVLRKRTVDQTDIGAYAFGTSLTSNCAGKPGACALDSRTGIGFASLLLGYATSFTRAFVAAPYTERRPEWAAFVQDDFRVSQRLTLNLGLRWDLFVPYVEDDDRQSNFDVTTGQFVTASEDAALGGLRVGRRLQTWSKTDFAPRLGFAWDLTGKGRTVVRGGVGMFWNNPLTGTSGSKGQNPPFLLSQAVGFQTSVVQDPRLRLSGSGVSAPGPATGGNSRSSFDRDFRDGYAQQWNLSVQQQVGGHSMFEIGYLGSRGRQIVVRKDVNQAPAKVGVTNPNVNRPFFAINPTLGAVAQSTSAGTLDYHALQARFLRRFANGISLTASYTFGKAIDIGSQSDGSASFTNSYDFDYNRGPADYDVTHTGVASWIYDLPFARRHKLGGWQLSGILLARSGYPFTVFQSQALQSTSTTSGPPSASYRPDRIGPGTLDEPTIDRWFDTDAFVQTKDTTGTYGNAGRNILRGPGQFTLDAALIKQTRFGHIDTELRIEAFNLLNHPVFANPVSSSIGTANVGTITSLMPNTPMRQVQLGLKVRF
jgi:hypothetical protein